MSNHIEITWEVEIREEVECGEECVHLYVEGDHPGFPRALIVPILGIEPDKVRAIWLRDYENVTE